jgi:hypothetical protein
LVASTRVAENYAANAAAHDLCFDCWAYVSGSDLHLKLNLGISNAGEAGVLVAFYVRDCDCLMQDSLAGFTQLIDPVTPDTVKGGIG